MNKKSDFCSERYNSWNYKDWQRREKDKVLNYWEGWVGKMKDRSTDRKTDRLKDRQKDRLKDRLKDRQKDRQKYRKSHTET